ncbi:uncharacterized protein LOC62_07G009585 [Vanrija pseudolonga]|uniref:Uncharacterized protein n=1 Tax=Vanrija pseudolonga TaxID=143232 RepID=A0AAF1BLM6_9TREE|nr:hypothetical protein LOC62_07G009585 [Vanrija pseudolonga]
MSISASAYPHLMDAILDAVPYSALLAFRATSKSFLGRIDCVLFRHVVLARPEEGDKPRSHCIGYTISTPDEGKLPVFPVHELRQCNFCSRRPADRARLLHVLSLTEIVDLRSSLPDWCYGQLAQGLTSLEIVRMLPRRVGVNTMPYRIPFNATTLVLKAGVAETAFPNSSKLHTPGMWSNKQFSRVVINTFYELGGVSTLRPIVSPVLNYDTAGIKELVLLFTPTSRAATRLTTAAEQGWRSFQTMTLADHAAEACINGVECTLVGLCDADPRWFEFKASEDLEPWFEDYVTDRIRRHLQAEVGDHADVPEEYLDACLQRLSFVSREEYERGRTAEQVAVERCQLVPAVEEAAPPQGRTTNIGEDRDADAAST